MPRSLLDALNSGRVLLMDGAMGTELQRAGLRPPKRPEDWNLERPDAVRAVHQAYVDAGADVLLTNTFQANAIAIADHSPGFLRDTWRSAIALARAAAGAGRFVIADIGPIVAPGALEFAQPEDVDPLTELAAAGGCDGVLLETCSTMRVRLAVEQARGAGLPVLLSLCFRHSGGRLVSFDRHAAEEFALCAAEWGAAALGVNCGNEVDVTDCATILRSYRETCRLPLFARPNAGTPRRDGDASLYPRTAEQMASQLPQLLDAGATMVGGCCGTTPAHLAAFAGEIAKRDRRRDSATS